MRSFFGLVAVPVATFLVISSPAHSQSNAALPGCEPAPVVRKILEERLGWRALDKMKFADQVALKRQVLEDLIATYPREYEPYRRLIENTRSTQPDDFPVLQERFTQLAKEHPDDPLALVLGGLVLFHKNTPESIRLLEMAKSKAPSFPWPSFELAEIYFQGKFADKNKVAENIAAFYAACPDSTNHEAPWILTKNPALQPKVAVALRKRLERETDPKRLTDDERLWGLEFRARPPQEHDALRKQVASDLKRLESLNPKGDAEWQAFVIKGYKQSGAPQETITAKEDLLLREYPTSDEAYEIIFERWRKAHKEPEDQNDAAAWLKYEAAYKEGLKGWIRDYPENSYLQRYAWFYAISQDDALAEKDGIAAVERFVKAGKEFEPPQYLWNGFANAADFLLRHGWQPQRAEELLSEAQTLLVKERQRNQQDDNRSADDIKQQTEQEIWQTQWIVRLRLKAAKQMGQHDVDNRLRASIEGSPLEDKKYQSDYWWNRASLAALENHTQDALAYYQLALQTRIDPPKAWRGKLRDDLSDEARALWKQQGGTEAAWAIWSKPPVEKSAELAEGRWEKPTKELPVFELADLSGKTWRLKELGGKTVLINLWATWCGPCNAELPRLEKFYEKNKGRSDVQVLTFNIDEDLGLVAPYLKEKGYTFPVLPAFSTVVSLLDGFAIPQNWIVDTKGTWRWSQIGYGGGTDADFEKEMGEKLESMKSIANP